MSKIDECVITLDIDWAPDWAIDDAAQILIEKNVKATWFVTHHSKAVDRLRERDDLFELGIHPNMLPGSTHGQTEDEVLAHILQIVPNATSMRTHGLYQSSFFLAKASRDYGITIDVSLFLPRTTNLTLHYFKYNGAKLWRIPYFWEDDVEMFEDEPIWQISDERLNVTGLRIFDFHPIHVALNTNKMELYNNLKQKLPLAEWDLGFVEGQANKNIGPRNLFLELADDLSGGGKQIRDLISNL